MANVINADNGVVSGSAGLKYSSDSTGVLALQTNGNTAVTITTANNVGIGTTSPTTALAIQTTGANGLNLLTDLGNSNASSRLFLGYNGDTASLYYGTSGWVFGTSATVGSSSGTQRLIIDPSGNLNIKTSNAGIIFNNSSASTNSTLNDYEQGTFTPTLGGSGSDPTGVSSSGVVGTYTKIGNTVNFALSFTFTTYTGGSGSLTIRGLPFTISGGHQYCGFAADNYFGWNSGYTALACYMVANGTSLVPVAITNNSGNTGISLTTYNPSNSNPKTLYIYGTYKTTF